MTPALLFQNALLIEDDASHAVLIKRALKRAVTTIMTATNLEEANKLLDANDYDLIVTDLHLPDSQGVRHVESLKAKAAILPIVVLTASSDLQVAIEAMKRGADEFIVKNFDQTFEEVLFLAMSRIYTAKLLRAEKLRIQRETDVLRIAIENSADAMAIAGSKGEVIYANKAFHSFVKKCGGDDTNLSSIFSTKVDKHEALKDSLKKNLQVLRAGGIWHSELIFTESKDLAFDISLSVVGSQPTYDSQFVFWAKDISEQKRRERFQREILSTTTHDLKGPLGAILLSCELVSGMLDPKDKAAQLVLRIDSSARGAVNMIDEFLSARRIQEGTFILKPSQHDVCMLLEDLLAEYKNIALARGINLSLDKKCDCLEVSVDKLAFSRIVGNLLSNALKFTPKGGKVEMSCHDLSDDYAISVTDTGSGMEPSEVKKVFERFTRLDKHSEVAGTGIGLFIVKALVAAHGGKVEVTSTPGAGTTFEITLPKKPPANERGELISLDFA